MSVTYNKEFRALARAKRIISFLPKRLQFRMAKMLYDYESDTVKGIDIVAPLQDNGQICYVNTKDLIGWKIFFFGEYETGTNNVIEKYVKSGDTVIEAGANIGSETIILSRLVGKGHVYGFEPNPYTFERLKINKTINELTNADVYDYALGEKDSTIHFNIYPKGFCNAGMSSKYESTPKTKKIEVTQRTLDSFVREKNIAKVDFIKMDIQGAEMDLIQGAANTIAQHKPIIFTEALEIYNNTKQLYETLKGYGYSVYYIEDNHTAIMASAADVKDGNWLAIFEKK
jgi:FkbM family methyltransferase